MEFILEIHESELNKLLRLFNIKFKDFNYIIVNNKEEKTKLSISSNNEKESSELLSELYETIFEEFETAHIREVVSAESSNIDELDWGI